MLALDELLLLMSYSQPILLLMDRAPWHFGDAMRDLLAQTDRLQVMYFPPACPDLNPQEHVWERARDRISHNHTYRWFDTLLDDFETYLNETAFETNFIDKLVYMRSNSVIHYLVPQSRIGYESFFTHAHPQLSPVAVSEIETNYSQQRCEQQDCGVCVHFLASPNSFVCPRDSPQ